MRDYAECSVIAKRLRFLADDLENAYGAEEGESLFADAADAIEELLDQRDKALKRLCEFCGICSEKSRTPLECEVAGFVVEPPKGVEPNGEV